MKMKFIVYHEPSGRVNWVAVGYQNPPADAEDETVVEAASGREAAEKAFGPDWEEQ